MKILVDEKLCKLGTKGLPGPPSKMENDQLLCGFPWSSQP